MHFDTPITLTICAHGETSPPNRGLMKYAREQSSMHVIRNLSKASISQDFNIVHGGHITLQFVNRCDREQKAALASERRQHRDKMRQKELAELHGTANRSATEEESIGRQSGSLAWRETRGETGNH